MSLSKRIHQMFRTQYDINVMGSRVKLNFEVLSPTVVEINVTRDDSSRGRTAHLIKTNLVHEMESYFYDNREFIRVEGTTRENLYLEVGTNSLFKYFYKRGLRDFAEQTEEAMLISILARTMGCSVDRISIISKRTYREIDHLTCCSLILNMINR